MPVSFEHCKNTEEWPDCPYPIPANLQAIADYAQSKGLVAERASFRMFGYQKPVVVGNVVYQESWSCCFYLALVDAASHIPGTPKNRVNRLTLSCSVYFKAGLVEVSGMNAEVVACGKKLFTGGIHTDKAIEKIDVFLRHIETFRQIHQFRREFFDLKA